MKTYTGRKLGRWIKALIALILAGALAFAALLGAVLAGSRDQIRGEPEMMIILGCQVRDSGPSVLLRDRLDKALAYLEGRPGMTVVVSGGQGSDEPMSEAQAMYDYLTAHGVDGGRILLEDRSRNTLQNLQYSIELLEAEGYDTSGDVAVVSTGLHLTRTRMIWGRLLGGDDNLSTLAAPASHAPSRFKLYIREPLALVKSFISDR